MKICPDRKQITAGTTGTPTSLLDLRYYSGTNTPAYDAVGNIKSILDATNSSQKQCFGYDGLDRLVSAMVGLNNDTCSGAVGDGEYPDETYTYDPTTGNLTSKTGLGNYTYGNPDHAHAVTATGNGNLYAYDDNGNQISRVIGSITYTLSYDAENRLVSVSWTVLNVSHSMTFVFDGDGSRVWSTLDGTTTTFAGTHYEVTSSAVTKYYYSGASRIAMRSSIGVRYIFGDHLGSASVTADRYGSSVTRQLYKPYGETRSSGSVPTKYTFTGQYAYSGSGEIGLMYYVARFFDPQLGRFVSADTLVPQTGRASSWDRYMYTRGNPINRVDPSGHFDNCSAISSKQCAVDNGWTSGLVKSWINARYGITMSDDGKKTWDKRNLVLMHTSLENVDSALRGGLRAYANGATLKLGEHISRKLEDGSMTQYGGVYSPHNKSITFDTLGDDAIRQMNIYHEFGHLVDSLPGRDNEFSNQIPARTSYIVDDYVYEEALIKTSVKNDPNHPSVQAIQASGTEPTEQWADIFANYVAGNISTSREGTAMTEFITDVLFPPPMVGTK